MPLSAERNRERNRQRRNNLAYRAAERCADRDRRRRRREESTNSSHPPRNHSQATGPSVRNHRLLENNRQTRAGDDIRRDIDGQQVTLHLEPRSLGVERNSAQNQWWHTIHASLSRSRWEPPTWDHSCQYCGALLLKGEERTFCCNNGQRIVPPLPPLPTNISNLISNHNAARRISACSRRLNNLFSFTAIGATNGFAHFRSGPASVAITGRTYHRILDVATPNHSLHWFLYDERERERHDINPYVHSLQQFHSVSDDATTALELPDTSSNGDFAAVMHAANSTNIKPRSILIWHNSKRQPSFISILTRHYEPLQYPLLFPHGTLGWGLTATSDSCQNRLSNTLGFTQREWYKGRILTDQRFIIFGRLCSEYLCDMYSRIEEERLAYIRRSRVSRAQEIHPDADDSSIDIELPASFLGSRKWASEQTADSLALARAFGKPSYFFTMTCNPEWPEITARLRPGQNASDVPVVVARAFKIRLQRLLQILRTHFGHLVYMIKVIEFQKRGFPHAHIIAKVSNSFTLVMH